MANVVANALSKKSMGSLAYISHVRRLLIKGIHKLEDNSVQLELGWSGLLLTHAKA